MPTHSLPRFFTVRQEPKGPTHPDIIQGVRSELEKLGLRFWVKPGQTVAITAGSRGLANIQVLTKTIIEFFKELNAKPFLIPAMGSHGGATAKGQENVLASYGLTSASLGVPINTSMDTETLGRTHNGHPIHFSKAALEADHVFVWNRIKAHTLLDGDIQSGLFKMLLVGLGKQAGAQAFHASITDHSMEQWIDATLPVILPVGKVLGGLAIVENSLDETATIEGIALKDWGLRERALLQQAIEWMPRIPFDNMDILIVDEMGKNISGTGLDTNVIGRKRYHECSAPDERPTIKRIAVRTLAPASKGNATGIGLADFTTTRLIESVNWPATYANALTAGIPARAKSPICFASDSKMLDAALNTIGPTPPQKAKIVWIKNTLDLSTLALSEACWDMAKTQAELEIETTPQEIKWESPGQLTSPFD